MKDVGRKVLKLVAQFTRDEIKREKANGHPFCLGIFHQPKRPVEEKK